jgi:ketosteroid isomerase-like protein
VTQPHRFESPEDCESAFYDAFERADLAAIMSVWADQEEIICVHPQGPRLVGFEPIRDAFAQIFAAGLSLRVQIAQGHQFHSQALAVHCVVEVIQVVGEKQSPPPMFVTNVFAYTDDGWRMIAHHATASPETSDGEPGQSHTLH